MGVSTSNAVLRRSVVVVFIFFRLKSLQPKVGCGFNYGSNVEVGCNSRKNSVPNGKLLCRMVFQTRKTGNLPKRRECRQERIAV